MLRRMAYATYSLSKVKNVSIYLNSKFCSPQVLWKGAQICSLCPGLDVRERCEIGWFLEKDSDSRGFFFKDGNDLSMLTG